MRSRDPSASPASPVRSGLRRDRSENPINFRLYLITNRRLCDPHSLYDTIHELLDAGLQGVQIREKDLKPADLLKLSIPIVRLCHSYSAQVFVNSHLQIVKDTGAEGIHLPSDSPSAKRVREVLGNKILIGCSVHDSSEAKKKQDEGADFITFSPVFPSLSKPGYGSSTGIDNLKKIVKSVEIPVFALGGIVPRRVSECLRREAFGVAVMSSLMQDNNRTLTIKRFFHYLERDSLKQEKAQV